MEKQRKIQRKDTTIEEEAALSMLREVELIGISVFKSFLIFLFKPKARPRGCSLVSKVLLS